MLTGNKWKTRLIPTLPPLTLPGDRQLGCRSQRGGPTHRLTPYHSFRLSPLGLKTRQRAEKKKKNAKKKKKTTKQTKSIKNNHKRKVRPDSPDFDEWMPVVGPFFLIVRRHRSFARHSPAAGDKIPLPRQTHPQKRRDGLQFFSVPG